MVKAISPEAAWQVNEALEDTMRVGMGSAAFTQFGLNNMPVAGKSGTAYNFTDTYFFGYDSSVTCGVWVGFHRPTQIYRGAFGKEISAAQSLGKDDQRRGTVQPPRPDDLKAVEICGAPGCWRDENCSRHEGAGAQKEHATCPLNTAPPRSSPRCVAIFMVKGRESAAARDPIRTPCASSGGGRSFERRTPVWLPSWPRLSLG